MLRVLTANLLVGRAAAEPVVELAVRLKADVLFVQELMSKRRSGWPGPGSVTSFRT